MLTPAPEGPRLDGPEPDPERFRFYRGIVLFLVSLLLAFNWVPLALADRVGWGGAITWSLFCFAVAMVAYGLASPAE